MTAEIRDKFGGIAPAISPRKLAESKATVAENVIYDGAQLRPFRDVEYSVDAPLDTESIFYVSPQSSPELQTRTGYRDYVRSFLPNDDYGMYFFTDGTQPKLRLLGQGGVSSEWKLGIDRPAAPTITTTDPDDGSDLLGDKTDPNDIMTWTYLVVFVDGRGRVGPTSNPSVPIEVGLDPTPIINRPPLPSDLFSGTGGNMAKWRVFRSNTGSQGVADYQFLDERTIDITELTDIRQPDELTYVAFSGEWIGPPNTMVGLTYFPGDFLLGYVDNEVYGSEPRVPHAWPYSWGFEEEIRGVASIQGGVLVVTNSSPWLLSGSNPRNLVKVPLDSDAACLSSRSLVDMGDMAIWAGRDGLYGAMGTKVVNLTEGAFDEAAWADFEPDTIRAFKHEQFYIGFYGTDTDLTGFIFDHESKEFMTLSGLYVYDAAFDPWKQQTHVVYLDGAATRRIGIFDRGASLTGRWRSREILNTVPISMSAFRLEAAAYPATVRVWADDRESVFTVANDKPRKIPGGVKRRRWQFELEITEPVDLFSMATSITETY